MITCIILSAGESQRFRSPKALARTSRRTAIEDLQNTLLGSIADEIIVVLGAYVDAVKPHVFNHKKVRIVYNKDYKLGQTSSFQTGLSAVGNETRAVLLAPVDCPLILTSTVDLLIRHFKQNNPVLLIPAYQGKRGHPPVFNASLKTDILALSPSTGVNSLFAVHVPEILEINDPGIVQAFNTPAELEQLVVSKSAKGGRVESIKKPRS